MIASHSYRNSAGRTGHCLRSQGAVTGIRTWIPSAAELLGFASAANSCSVYQADDRITTTTNHEERTHFGYRRFCSLCINRSHFEPISGSHMPFMTPHRAGGQSHCIQERLALQQRLKAQAHEIASLRHLVDNLANAMQRCNSKNLALQVALDSGSNLFQRSEVTENFGNFLPGPALASSPTEESRQNDTPCLRNNWELTENLERIRDLLLVTLVKVKELENQVKRIPELEQMRAEFLRQMASRNKPTDAECLPPSKKSLHDNSPDESDRDSNSNFDQTSDIPNDVTDCDDDDKKKNNNNNSNNKSELLREMALLQKHWEEAEKDWEDERFILLEELERRRQEVEEQEAELNLLEEERNKFQLHETKVKDILKVLRNLKLLNIPHRTLGKILIQSLSACRDQSRPENHVRNFLEQLYQNLLGCEILHTNSLLPLALQIGNGD